MIYKTGDKYNDQLSKENIVAIKGACAVSAWLLCTLVFDGYSAVKSSKGLAPVLLQGTGALLKLGALVTLGIMVTMQAQSLGRTYYHSQGDSREDFKSELDGRIVQDATYVGLATVMLNTGYFGGDDIKAGIAISVASVALAVSFVAISSAYICMPPSDRSAPPDNLGKRKSPAKLS